MSKDRLLSGEVLNRGSEIFSENKNYKLRFSTKGNLFLYNAINDEVIWRTHVKEDDRNKCIMKNSGRLVIQRGSGKILWKSSNRKYAGGFAKVQNDGNFVIYSPTWKTNTVGR
ncbi:D-mannose binding lectin [Kordia sp. SMS9]|uniref:bulb-type lectin domain-containing protein n=1 Tax=Kordia sp. SMS9 TaxID=2282170 RepID=UPI000E0D5A23|nr:bulb-type lectin domain-containing protein [Kordia sp. SMS9]AXG71634.1 D-mannose binding lectin [Kordia sp. SMS9]